LLSDRNMILVAIAGFGALWGTWGFAFWSNSLMVKGHGMEPARAAAIVATFGIGAAVAKPLIGWLSDLLGGVRKPLALACLAAFTAMLLVFGALTTDTAFLIAAPILGVTAFAYSPLLTALVAELAGNNAAGSASGVTNAFWQIGSFLVPLAVGAVFGATGSFFTAFATLACGPLLAVLALSLARERRAKPQRQPV
jgi:sugar phosphate permease